MTFSIVARCPKSGEFGIAATTALPAVGKLLAHASPHVGAVATQALLNPYLGIDGLDLLKSGMNAQETLEALKLTDPAINYRQIGLVDKDGKTAIWTGENCLGWAGGQELENFCVQGNRLRGPEVIEVAVTTYKNMSASPLVERLVQALAAGMAAGGDRREERSANVYVVADEDYPLWDIRVDDHDDPINELIRLRRVFSQELLPHIRRMATRANPTGIIDEAS